MLLHPALRQSCLSLHQQCWTLLDWPNPRRRQENQLRRRSEVPLLQARRGEVLTGGSHHTSMLMIGMCAESKTDL